MRHLKNISRIPAEAQDLPLGTLLAAVDTIIKALIDVVGAIELIVGAKDAESDS